ncbi:MAG: P-loop NTPase fold protein [Undibacterium sp.]|uniref:KAP family P-loop NTPase fold protein n=1 Tax=Undibacterium sp. TaxID=1914977 RepID=UPI002717361F|nr:P-loop NTPase fold protein [Undibacterium sp.]MDO8653484.1 P-loop NTPase fold protein [Undibacterium sp.]
MWHDNETTVDYVNFNLVATACANLIREADGEPISIGISGGWGTGKSSLVRMVERELSPPDEDSSANQFIVATFNPWLYQGFEDARTALLQIVGDAVLARAASNKTLFDKAQALLKRINFLRLTQLGGEVAATLITGVPVGLLGRAFDAGVTAMQNSSVSDGLSAAKAVPSATKGLLDAAKPISLPQEIQEFRNSLEELLKELKITLVIFVDDLDRCLPKTAIATLEAIRLLLFLKRSAFVVAADDAFIRGAVRVHFAGTGIDDDIATNYFDKLIQVPLRVPRLGPNETKAYTALLFLENALKKKNLDKTKFETAIQLVGERLRESWKDKSVDLNFLESLVPQDNTELLGLMGLAERLAPLLLQASAVQSNPRLIKRFLNTVFLRKALAKPQGIDVDVQVLAKWHLLERCDETIANALADKVSANTDGRVHLLREAEAAAEAVDVKLPAPFGDQPFAREWLQLPPKLGDFDLRPVLHLSRDSTIRDFGADELNQAGKQLRDGLMTARTSSEILKEQIRAAGEQQAIIAMTRAWDQRASIRTWQKADENLMLTEVCNEYSGATNRAITLLSNAPKAQLAPAFVHPLLSYVWAKSLLVEWEKHDHTPTIVKNAINQGNK